MIKKTYVIKIKRINDKKNVSKYKKTYKLCKKRYIWYKKTYY